MDRIIWDMAKVKGSHHQGKRMCRKTSAARSKTRGATDQKDKGELSKGDIRELKWGPWDGKPCKDGDLHDFSREDLIWFLQESHDITHGQDSRLRTKSSF